MKKWMQVNKLILLGVLVGAFGGYFYYHFIGCMNGTCMISSKPLNSVLYFGLMGGLFSGMFKK
jgi:phage shock protein E